MNDRAVLRFLIDGRDVLTISPAKLLEAFFYPGQFNHLPHVVAFPIGSEILCCLEIKDYRLASLEKVIQIPNQEEQAAQIAANLITRLKKG